MTYVSVSDFKSNPTSYFDIAKSEAVTVEKHGKPVAVIISPEDFSRYESLEDAYWSSLVKERLAESGFLGKEATLELIATMTAEKEHAARS